VGGNEPGEARAHDDDVGGEFLWGVHGALVTVFFDTF
jgi:hypothetical protein